MSLSSMLTYDRSLGRKIMILSLVLSGFTVGTLKFGELHLRISSVNKIVYKRDWCMLSGPMIYARVTRRT